MLDRDGLRIVRVDLNQVAEAVELVRLLRQVEAVVQALPLALRRVLGHAEALHVRGRALTGDGGGVGPVLVDVLLARKEGAPRGHTAGAVVEGAEDRSAGRIGGGLEQVVAGSRPDDLELGLPGDAAVQRAELALELTGLGVLGHLEDGVAVADNADIDLLVRRVLRIVVRQHLRFSGVLVGADVEHAVLVGRVLHQAGEVVVEAELAGCSCGGLVVRVELRGVLVHRVAPGDQHRGVVARRDDNLVLLVRLHAVETHASSRLDFSLRNLGAGGGGRRGFGGFRHILVDAAGGEQCAAAEGHGASAECLQHAAAGHQVAEVRVVGLVGAIASTRVAALVGTGQRRALGLEQQVNTLDRHEFSQETYTEFGLEEVTQHE